jgi:hypothetical protein
VSKLDDILIDRMVGDMTKILVPSNADKSVQELNNMVVPKMEQCRQQIKDLMHELIGEVPPDYYKTNYSNVQVARYKERERLHKLVNEL